MAAAAIGDIADIAVKLLRNCGSVSRNMYSFKIGYWSRKRSILSPS